MAVALSETPILQFWNNSGQLNAGGTLLTQVGGVNYPTYQDPAGLIPLPNPIPLNSRGEVSNSSGVSSQLYLMPGIVYVFTLYDCFGNQLWIAEDVMGISSTAVGNLNDEKGSNGQPGFSAANGDFTPGTTTTLTLSQNYGSAANLWVAFDGVEQGANSFSLGGTDNKTLTFFTPIPVGTAFVFVKGGTTLTIGTPGPGTVTDSSIPNNANINSSKIGFLQAGVGAVNRTVLSKLREVQVSVKDFGAIGDGAADDTAAINAAIAEVSSLNGGTVYFPPGKYAISSTLLIESSDVKLIGAGHGGFHYTGTFVEAATQLIWSGGVGVTMVQFTPAPGATQRINACEFRGIYLVMGAAGNGLLVVSHTMGVFEAVGHQYIGQPGTLLFVTCISPPLTGDPGGTQDNTFYVLGTMDAGPLLRLDGSVTENASFNRIPIVDGNYGNGNGIVCANSDNNFFEFCRLGRNPGSVGSGVVFAGSAGPNQSARQNIFLNMSPGAGGCYSQGTSDAGVVYPAGENYIQFYDTANGWPAPSGGTGAVVTWGTNQTPLGIRSQSLNNISSGFSTIVYSDGRTKISGQTSTITSGGNQTITLPNTPSIGVLKVSLTPIGVATATACVNPPSGNTVVVVCGSTTSGFFFEIEYI
jgi:Pectate lyase superfamily protein